MAENDENAKTSSSNPEPGKENPVSDVSLVTTGNLRERIICEIKKNKTDQAADNLLIEAVQDPDRHCKKWWQCVLVVAMVVFILHTVCAGWQWQTLGGAITSQLLEKGNVDASRILVAVSDLSSHGERTYYVTIILGLIICVVAWLGWTKSSQSNKAQAMENATKLRSVVATKDMELTGMTAIATTYEARIDKIKKRKKALDEEIEKLRSSDKTNKEHLENLCEERKKIEEELTTKSDELKKTKEAAQEQVLEMEKAQNEQVQKLEEEKALTQELQTQIADKETQLTAALDKEKALRQRAEKDLEAEAQKVKELEEALDQSKKSKWWPW